MSKQDLTKQEQDVLDLLLRTSPSIDLKPREIGSELDLDPELVEVTIIPALQHKEVPVQRWMSGWRIPGHLRVRS